MEEIRNEYFWLEAKDADTITLCDFNRPLVEKHVAQIEKALEENCVDFVTPIIVGLHNGQMKVVDGNHRLRALLNLHLRGVTHDKQGKVIRLRVQTIINPSINFETLMLKVNNTSLSWNVLNYVQFNAHRGNVSCINFLNFMDSFSIDTVTKGLAYFGKSSLSKAQSEDLERFPVITDRDVQKAKKFFLQIENVPYQISSHLSLHTANGIRYFVKYFADDVEFMCNLIKWSKTVGLGCSLRYDCNSDYRYGSKAHWEEYLQQLINLYNKENNV